MKNSPSARVVVPRLGPRAAKSHSAVALVLTLLIVAMLTVVVVGFTTVSRIEQSAARNMTHLASAEQLAQLATSRAMQRLGDAMQTAAAAPMFSTQPGQINPFGAAAEPLYSSGTATTNVNRFTTNGLITGNPADSVTVGVQTVNDSAGNPLGRVAFYIDDESTKIAVNQATGASNNRTLNPQWPRPFAIQGADGVNEVRAGNFNGVLTYSANTPTSISNWTYFFTPEQLRGPLTAEPLQQLTVATETNSAAINTTPWGAQKIRINQIPVADQGAQQLVQALSDPKLTEVFGQTFADKYTPEGLKQLAANMLQLRTGYWSMSYLAPDGTNYGKVLEDVVLGLEDLPSGAAPIPAANSGLEKKTNGIPERLMGYIPFPMLAEIAVGGLEYGFTKAVDPVTGQPPDDNMEIRFFVACKLFNPFPVDYPGGGEILVQIDKARVRMTNANPSTLGPPASGIWRGPDGSHKQLTPGYNDMPNAGGNQPWDPWGLLTGNVNTALAGHEKAEPNPVVPANPPQLDEPLRGLDPANGVATRPIPPIAAGATANVFVPFSIVTSARHPTTGLFTGAGAEMYIIVDQVRLSAEANQANSVRDWCSGPDMKSAFQQEETAQFVLPITPAIVRQGTFQTGGPPLSLTPPNLDPSRWVSIVKKDPRIKPGFEVAENEPAWRTNAATLDTSSLALSPVNFESGRLPPDSGTVEVVIYNTNLPPLLSFSTSAGGGGPSQPGGPGGDGEPSPPLYSMAADLGKVFTGAPWRTLRLQPQPAAEAAAGLIPDWVLLDAVSFGDGARALNSANPNSQIISLTNPVTRRTAAIRSQLDVLTNQTLNIVAHPIIPGETNTAFFTTTAAMAFRTNAAGLAEIATSAQRPQLPLSWSTNSSWPARRAALGFPANALLLPSEMAEIRGVADFFPSTGATVNSNKFNEYRLSTLFPGAGSRSRFFRIYALGEALEGRAANAPVAAKAFLQTLVEVDITSTPPSIRIVNQYPPAE